MSFSLGQQTVLEAVKNESLIRVKQLFNPDYLTGSNGDEFGFKLLMAAIERNHKSMVYYLLCRNCKATRPNEEIIIHDTPLHWAVRTGYDDMVKVLLRKGASVQDRGLGQKSVIHEAWEKNWKRKSLLIYKLLESSDFCHSSPNNADDLLHFSIACQNGCEKAVEKFVQLGFPVEMYLDMADVNKRGYRPLHYAVVRESLSIVQLLLNKNVDINSKSDLGFTPLHVACEHGKIDMIQLLLQNGADPNIKNNEGQTSFHLAFYKKQYVTHLLKSEISKDINHIDSRGLSHFHILCTTDSHTTIATLVQSGVATVDMCVNDDEGLFSGYSALHFAVEFNREHVVKLLLQHDAKVNYYPSFTKVTPLHLACMHSDIKYHQLIDPVKLEMIEYVIREGDWTIKKQSQINIIKLLLDHKCNVNARDHLEKVALMYACEIHTKQLKSLHSILSERNRKNIVNGQLWLIQKEIIEILLLYNADIHIQTSANESILHSIIKSDYASLELCKFFIKKGLGIHLLDGTGSSLLHHAVNMSHEFIVEFLLRLSLDVNVRDHKFSTCLHIIAANNSKTSSSQSIIKRLLQNNADVELSNGNKQTPLDVAFSSENSYAFNLLLQYGADINNINFLMYLKEIDTSPFVNYSIRMKRTIINSLFAHVKKLDILEFHVNRDVRAYLEISLKFFGNQSREEIIEPNDISLRYLKEIEKMISIKINPYNTLFDVLHKDKHSMAKCARNGNLKTILTSKSFEEDFPQLGFSLRLQFRRGLARKDLLKYSSDSLYFLVGFHLPETILDKIFGYLLDVELDCLNKAGSEKFQKITQSQKSSAKRQRL